MEGRWQDVGVPSAPDGDAKIMGPALRIDSLLMAATARVATTSGRLFDGCHNGKLIIKVGEEP